MEHGNKIDFEALEKSSEDLSITNILSEETDNIAEEKPNLKAELFAQMKEDGVKVETEQNSENEPLNDIFSTNEAIGKDEDIIGEKKSSSGEAVIKKLITPELAITLFDSVISRLGVFLPSEGVTQDHWRLTQDEKKELKPIVEEVIQNMQLSMKPETMLVILLGSIYAFKYFTAKQITEAIKAEKAKKGKSAEKVVANDEIFEKYNSNQRKEETRGRHKKDCDCEKCVGKKINP